MSAIKISPEKYHQGRMSQTENVSVLHIESPYNRKKARALIEGLHVSSDVDAINVQQTGPEGTYLVWRADDHTLPDKYDDAIVRVVADNQIWATGYGWLIADRLLEQGKTVKMSENEARRRDLLYRLIEPVAA